MKKEKVQSLIAGHFAKIVQKDRKIHNAYLLIHSGKLGIHLNNGRRLNRQYAC